MKRAAILCLTTLLAAGVQAQTFNDTARVRTVNPQYENVSVPRNECTNQWVTEPQPVASSRNYGGLAIGGVAMHERIGVAEVCAPNGLLPSLNVPAPIMGLRRLWCPCFLLDCPAIGGDRKSVV